MTSHDQARSEVATRADFSPLRYGQCWNLLASRSRPAALAHRLEPLDDVATALRARDRVPLYSALGVEEVL